MCVSVAVIMAMSGEEMVTACLHSGSILPLYHGAAVKARTTSTAQGESLSCAVYQYNPNDNTIRSPHHAIPSFQNMNGDII